MNRATITKVFSTTLSLALAVSSMPMPAGAFGPVGPAGPAFAERLAPSARFGYVSSSYAPHQDAEAPRLILISDLHAHVEVQHNIEGILNDLVNKLNPASGQKVPIFVEGGYEPHLEEPLREVANPQARAFLAEYLLQKSQIGSAQGFSEQIAGSGKVSLVGVENKAEYEANRKHYVSTYPERKRLLMALAREEKALKELSSYLSNGSFEKLQSMRDGYNAGRITLERYAKALSHQADHLHIAGAPVDTVKNWQNASARELDAALAQVYGAVAVRLSNKAPWTSFLRQSLGDEKTMRENIARFDSDFDLLKRLVADQLTPGEVPLAMARMPNLTHMAEMLVSDKEAGLNVKNVVEESLDFYPYAFLRDKILIQNSLKSLDAMGSSATGILVAGGFHAEAIEQYLQTHGISYMHINPSITRDMTTEEEINYARRMGNDPITTEELDQDLESLTTGTRQTSLASSAIGPSTNSQTPQKMGDGGLGRLLAGKNITEQLAVLKAQGLPGAVAPGTRGDQNVLELATLGEASQQAAAMKDENDAARLANLARALNKAAKKEPELAKLKISGDDRDSFTVTRVHDGQRLIYKAVGVQPLDEAQQAWLDRLNASFDGTQTRPGSPDTIDVFLTEDEEAITMDAEALTLPAIGGNPANAKYDRSKQRAAIVMTRSRMVNPQEQDASKIMQGFHAQAHEVSHVLLAGKNEPRALINGLFYAGKMAANHFANMDASAAITKLLDAIVPQMSLYEGANDKRYDAFVKLFQNAEFRVALAEQIAKYIQGPNLSDKDIEAIAKSLQEKFPEVPKYLIDKTLTDTVSRQAYRLGSSDNPETVKGEVRNEAEEKIAKPAGNILVNGIRA